MTRTLLTLVFLLFLIAPARAAIHESDEYGPVHKLGRGVADMTTGVLELPGSIKEETDADGASGIPLGLGKGLVRTVARELVGVYEFVTFPLPVPSGYRPVMHPEYPWQYFDGSRVDIGSRERGTGVGTR